MGKVYRRNGNFLVQCLLRIACHGAMLIEEIPTKILGQSLVGNFNSRKP